MTVDAFPGQPSYTIDGTGPYAIDHEYTAGSIKPFVILEGVVEYLADNEFSVSPEAGASGNLTLTTVAATARAGQLVYIERITDVEQGWEGQHARERGIEDQMDRLTQATQDVADVQMRTIRLATGVVPPLVPVDGRAIVWDEAAGAFTSGADFDEIAELVSNAELLEAKAQEAKDARDDILSLNADANTLTPGSTATASYDAGTKTLTFGIPRGDVGPQGAPGAGTGDVVGPASATDSNFAAFDDVTGKIIKDSGSKAADFATAAQGGKADAAIPAPTGAADGDLLVRAGGVWSLLTKGAADQVLIMNDGATAPGWEDLPSNSYVQPTTLGAIGTYIFGFTYGTTKITAGLSVAGSVIEPAGIQADGASPSDDLKWTAELTKGGAALSGTWRAMGQVNQNTGTSVGRATLFLRIS